MSSLLCQSPAVIMESGIAAKGQPSPALPPSCPEVLPLRLSPAYSGKAGGGTTPIFRNPNRARNPNRSIQNRTFLLNRKVRAELAKSGLLQVWKGGGSTTTKSVYGLTVK
jgi:hypothetical protein